MERLWLIAEHCEFYEILLTGPKGIQTQAHWICVLILSKLGQELWAINIANELSYPSAFECISSWPNSHIVHLLMIYCLCLIYDFICHFCDPLLVIAQLRSTVMHIMQCRLCVVNVAGLSRHQDYAQFVIKASITSGKLIVIIFILCDDIMISDCTK